MTSLGDREVAHEPSATRSWRATLRTNMSIRAQRRTWGGRADTWDRHNDFGMAKVATKAIEVVDLRAGMDCVDLGCGTGRLAFMLAQEGANVIGVDASAAMIRRMEARSGEEGVATIRGIIAPIELLDLATDSADLVITNYALHHLRDADKEKVVKAAYEWLRPGGQLVVADMMLGRGAAHRDREIIASKLRIMAKKGIPGYWRILKNTGRFLFRIHERPIAPEAWRHLFEAAGFSNVQATIVVAEAAVVTGVKPVS